MNSPIGISRFLHWLLLPAAVAISWPAAIVFAQDAASSGPVEEVVVTGSRIRQDPLDQKQPVLNISQEDLQRSGLADVGTYLQRLSISGSPLNTKFNSSGNFGFPPDGGGIGAGATQVDLRYLGCNRVLVLVDGMRWVNGASASGVSSCVDLNTIPITIIERIEILEGGASPIYGSDAISGVVNIITKDEFSGIELSAYAGVTDEGDGNTQEYSLALGTSDDDSSAFFSFTYYDQDKVNASDRSQAFFPVPGTGVTRGSSGTPQGRFFFEDPRTGLTNDVTLNNGVLNDGMGNIPQYDLNNPGTLDFHDFSCASPTDPNCDRFNFSPFNLVLTPSERWNIYGQGTKALTPDVNVYIRGSYTNRESTNQAAPEPIFIGSDAGTGGLPDTIDVDVTNPYNPFGLTLDASTMVYFIGRRPLEGGPRIFDQDVNTWHVAGGFEGAFSALDREFFWDLNGAWAQNNADQVKQGGYNAAKIQRALGPVALCTAPCVPLNIFGGQTPSGGSITPDMLNYIGFVQKDRSDQDLVVVSGNISSTIVDLPAGALAFAAGFEHREQDGTFQPDAVVVAGDSNGVPSSPTGGGFDVDEFYVELRADLLEGKPFADLLDVQFAARNSDYDSFGDDTNVSYGMNWRPIETFLVRVNYAEGFRAPGIGELYGSVSRFDAQLADPCSNFLNSGVSQTIINNCISQGVNMNGSYVQFNPQISVSTGGNSTLQPEDSDTTTVSLVWSPNAVDNLGWVDGFTAEVLFYDIELDDAIQALDAQTQLDQCAATNDPALCSGISRTGNGVINGFSNQLTNIGGIDTNGYDINLTYVSPETNFGTFKLSWFNTFVDEFKETSATGSRKLEGIEENDSSIPEWKSTFITDWYMGNFGASWTIRHIDEVTEDCTDASDGTANGFTTLGLCSNPNAMTPALSTNDLDETTYHDVQFTWTPQDLIEGLQLSVGIQNLFDEDPPKCLSCSLNGYDAATHDAPGQFGYVRAVMSFD